MDIHIEAQQTEIDASFRASIAERLAALNTPYEDIMHARVTLVKHERHGRGSDEARIFLMLSGKTLSASHQADTLEDAFYDVLGVMERSLHDFRVLRRGVVKEPGPRSRGRIARLFPDQGYGFIVTDTNQEVYFHANSVHGIPFEKLALEMPVDLDIEAGHRGPQASRVTPHHLYAS